MRAMRKDRIDLAGGIGLVCFSAVLAGNQIVVKLTNDALSPVFQAGVRSLGAALVVWIWAMARGVSFGPLRPQAWPGVILGLLFSFEFLCLFTALDLTTVSRASIIFYTMPMHLSLAAHFLIPGERLSPQRVVGLVLAFGGVFIVLADRAGGEASLAGDLLALCGAFGWAGIALVVRITPLSEAPPESQQLWQLVISSPILLGLAPLMGPVLRDVGPEVWALMGYQIVAVASLGFLAWFYLMKTYPASNVASFAFLTPVFSVVLAWLLLGEPLRWTVIAALTLVSLGIFLINRR